MEGLETYDYRGDPDYLDSFALDSRAIQKAGNIELYHTLAHKPALYFSRVKERLSMKKDWADAEAGAKDREDGFELRKPPYKKQEEGEIEEEEEHDMDEEVEEEDLGVEQVRVQTRLRNSRPPKASEKKIIGNNIWPFSMANKKEALGRLEPEVRSPDEGLEAMEEEGLTAVNIVPPPGGSAVHSQGARGVASPLGPSTGEKFYSTVANMVSTSRLMGIRKEHQGMSSTGQADNHQSVPDRTVSEVPQRRLVGFKDFTKGLLPGARVRYAGPFTDNDEEFEHDAVTEQGKLIDLFQIKHGSKTIPYRIDDQAYNLFYFFNNFPYWRYAA